MKVKRLLLKLLVLFWGISTTQVYASENMTSKKLKDTEIRLGSSVYTKSQIRNYLDLILDKKILDKKEGRNFIFYKDRDFIFRLGNEEDKNRVGYYFYENGYSQILETFDLYLSEIATITNLDIYKVEHHEVVPNIALLYLNSPIELYEVPNIKNLYLDLHVLNYLGKPNMYNMVLSTISELKNNPKDYASSIYLMSGENPDVYDLNYVPYYLNIRYILKSDLKNIDKFANETVLKDMIGAFIIHTPKEGEIKETLTNVNANPLVPPNMYTFDKALLKAMYSDDFIFGTPREESLDWLSTEIFQLIKSGEIK